MNSAGKTDADVAMYFAQIKNPYPDITNPCGTTKIDATDCDPHDSELETGSETFNIVAGKYMYLNGYEILITAPNEGLLYLPLIQSRIPVEWSGLTVMASEDGIYGCVTEGEARMQGSITGAIGRDLHRQVLALLTQGAGSFSGKFGEALEKVQEKANQIKGGDNSQETLKDLAAAIKSVEDGIEKYNASLTNQLNDPNFEYYGSSFISETISQLNGIKDKLTTVSECIDTETGVSSSKRSDFSGMHRMVILQNCFVADTLINQAGTQIPALIDNVKNTLQTIPPGTKLLSWEEGVRFQVGTVITQAALNETAANCATSPAKKESKNYEICNLTNGAIKAVYIPKSGQGDKHWAFQLDHPSVSGWVKEYVPGVATTNRYAVCLKTEVLTDGTCEYKEYDLEKGQYVGVLAADHMARMYAFLFEMIATGGTAPTVGVAAIESILMIAGEVCQTINFTEGNDMVLLLNAVNVGYQVKNGGRSMSQAERQALEGALNSTDDGISFFKKYKEKGKAFFDELAGKIRGADNWISKFPKLASKIEDWKSLGLVFEESGDVVRVLSSRGDEVAQVYKNGSDEIFEIADDFFRATPTNPATPITELTVKANTGETIIGAGFFKNADGSIGFVEDVSSYGSAVVQNTIKNRGALRGTLSGIKATEDAHHIIPVQLLKENDMVKKAVEAGFEFNSATNGIAIEKFVKATGVGRHGPHPNYTNQIRTYLNQWVELYPNFTPQMAKNELDDIVDLIKNKINTTSEKINDLNLGL